MKITLIAFGTRGDVQPSIALAKALQAKGHHLKLLASQNFKSWIESYGLEAAPASVDIQTIMNSEGGHVWIEQGNNPMKQLQAMKALINQYGRAMVDDAWAACQGAEAVISQFTSAAYMVSVAQKLNVPHICMLLQPALLATRDGRAATNPVIPERISILNYWMGRLVIEPASWSMYGDITNQFRADTLGLSPMNARQFADAFLHTPIVLGYSPQVAATPADWPNNIYTSGFFFLKDDSNWQPPDALTQFIEAEKPPVYIGFGSMTGRDVKAFTQLMVEAVRLSNQRAILAAGWSGLGEETTLPDTIYRLDSAPHDWLFPRMSAVVHHGGAGTTAAAFYAGTPQIIVPHMADQPFWGRKVHALGVGPKPIPRPNLTAQGLAAAINEAASSPDIKSRAEKLGAVIRSERGLENAVAFIQKYLR
jgi:UDP:flavonoid glycosyltransferase YjiC (YdhE family)